MLTMLKMLPMMSSTPRMMRWTKNDSDCEVIPDEEAADDIEDATNDEVADVEPLSYSR
jgi:methionine synthase II (cobalamin-independent)